NSLLIHPEADFSKLPDMLASVVTGAGRLPWALSRVYVSESRADEFFEGLKRFMSELTPLTSPTQASAWTPVGSRFDRTAWDSLKALVTQDHGKVIVGGEEHGSSHVSPLFVRDLTNCSTLQLDELASPLVIVTTVKYPHEMVKWTNTGDFGVCASVWGPVEKAQKLAAKLQVAEAWVNDWWTGDQAFAGLKRSFFGIPDFEWKGEFFSDVKKMTIS
ncbi:MAG: aldehyde dehydrogenase family protein, partial [Bdellovibrionaceae bacterium]|nr:aldehyde dehydrogenase family protein [Pseudobdellovibrionaceae bacterium]